MKAAAKRESPMHSATQSAKVPTLQDDPARGGDVPTTFKGREPVVELTVDGAVSVQVKARQGDKPLGSDDERFLHVLIDQIITASSKGGTIDKPRSEFALAVVQAIDPRDEVESMLAAQMAAVHMATMVMARRLNHAETIPQQDSAGSLLNKLARTYASQAEALKKYRTGGEQKITVQHVTVNDGGQAVVGNINARGKHVEEGGGDG
jgi:hypothetical protein